MALIKVGIHENLVLTTDTEVNDKGTLVLGIKAAQDENSLLNAFEDNTTFEDMSQKFIFWLPNMTTMQKTKKSSTDLASDLLKRRHQLMEYAKLFGTAEEINAAFGGVKMFEGCGQNDSNKAIAMLINEEFLKKVVKNLDTLFVDFLKSKNAFDGKTLFRQKFPRQSEANNYASIPNSTFDTWLESMDIPKEQSKIAWSEWEIKNKKNIADPIAATKKQSTPVDVKKASALFKKVDDTAAPNLDN